MNSTRPTRWQIAAFLNRLLHDGRLHPADVQILKAHAQLGERGGENWEIANAAAKRVVQEWRRKLKPKVKKKISAWKQPPSWHAADCMQRWLGHALAQEFPYYGSQIKTRESDGTKRWWMALGEPVETIGGKCIRVKLRREIADAVKHLKME